MKYRLKTPGLSKHPDRIIEPGRNSQRVARQPEFEMSGYISRAPLTHSGRDQTSTPVDSKGSRHKGYATGISQAPRATQEWPSLSLLYPCLAPPHLARFHRRRGWGGHHRRRPRTRAQEETRLAPRVPLSPALAQASRLTTGRHRTLQTTPKARRQAPNSCSDLSQGARGRRLARKTPSDRENRCSTPPIL